ncbi:MAG: hypothetical protein NVSMB51_04440 [Solirubrobacteraceae bacterium]
MGQRSRKRGRERPRERSETRAAAVRAELEPIGEGSRPAPLVIGVVVCALLGLANAALYFAGTKIQGKQPGAGVLAFSVVMIAAAAGMWQLRYWAVLGFQALLALIVLTFGLFLVRASNVEALLLCVAVIGCGGWLFWKMVRVMARIQMPTRPSR